MLKLLLSCDIALENCVPTPHAFTDVFSNENLFYTGFNLYYPNFYFCFVKHEKLGTLHRNIPIGHDTFLSQLLQEGGFRLLSNAQSPKPPSSVQPKIC